MVTKLNWKKSVFSNLYNIYSNGQQVGTLKDKTFSQTTTGELNGKKYTFKTKGIFKQHTEIIDNMDNKVVGEITYNNWMTKATISINNKTINWRYDNIWNTKWSIFNSEGISIKYAGSSSSGRIDANVDDSIIILSGLFVTNYYWQMTIVVLIAAFIPIWTATMN